MAPLVFTRPLLATEHSEYDTGAEQVAIDMARHCALPLAVVMPIVSNPEYEATTPEVAGRADDALAERRQAFAEQARAAGVDIDLQTRRGLQLWREVIEQAGALDTDVLVIRRRGRPGLLAKLLIGDMVHKVLSHAPCPVLVCPRASRMWRQRVLVAIAPGGQDGEVLRVAAELAQACQLPLTLLRVADEDAGAELEAMAAPWRAAGLEVAVECRSGQVHREVIAAVQAAQADLLVMGSHVAEWLGRAWIGGTAQKLIGVSETPVLVIPPEKRSEKKTP